MGMAIIDAVFDKCQLGNGKMAEGGDWAEVIRILTAGKVSRTDAGSLQDRGLIIQAILLLPTTPASSLPITPQILRDHILFIAQSSGCMTPLHERRESEGGLSDSVSIAVSLSGMVGTYSK